MDKLTPPEPIRTNRDRAIAFAGTIPAICEAFDVPKSTALKVQACWWEAIEKGEFGKESQC